MADNTSYFDPFTFSETNPGDGSDLAFQYSVPPQGQSVVNWGAPSSGMGTPLGDTDKAAVTSQVSNLEALATQTTNPSAAKNVIEQAAALRIQLSKYDDWSSSWTPVALGGYASLTNLKARVDAVTQPEAYPVLWNAARGTAADFVAIQTLGIVQPPGQYDPVTGTYTQGGAVTDIIRKNLPNLPNLPKIPDLSTILLYAGGFALLAIAVNAYSKGRGGRR